MEETYRILAEGHTVSNNTWLTGLNNNDLIIGPSGSGKTRGYVKPNILQCSESMVITDTKGVLCQEVGPVLEREGYRVMELNLADCAAPPMGITPLRTSGVTVTGTVHRKTSSPLPPAWCPLKRRMTPFGSLWQGCIWNPPSATPLRPCRSRNATWGASCGLSRRWAGTGNIKG